MHHLRSSGRLRAKWRSPGGVRALLALRLPRNTASRDLATCIIDLEEAFAVNVHRGHSGRRHEVHPVTERPQRRAMMSCALAVRRLKLSPQQVSSSGLRVRPTLRFTHLVSSCVFRRSGFSSRARSRGSRRCATGSRMRWWPRSRSWRASTRPGRHRTPTRRRSRRPSPDARPARWPRTATGVGFTADHPFHRFLKRTLSLEGLFGSTDEIALDLGRRLLAARCVPTLIEL